MSDVASTEFVPVHRWIALDQYVITAARTRIEGTWSAYIGAVPGWKHNLEIQDVLDRGTKLPEEIARVLFPEFAHLPYAH